LADWVGRAAWHLRQLHERLLLKLKQRSKLFADKTTMPVLDPGRGGVELPQPKVKLSQVNAQDYIYSVFESAHFPPIKG